MSKRGLIGAAIALGLGSYYYLRGRGRAEEGLLVVTNIDVPETVTLGETVSIEVTVYNPEEFEITQNITVEVM